MAQKVFYKITCDVCEGDVDAVQTVRFGLGGRAYAMELCEGHLESFQGQMDVWADAARRDDSAISASTPTRRRRQNSPAVSSNAEELAAIRAWARSNGYPVSDRGRIAKDIREAYAEYQEQVRNIRQSPVSNEQDSFEDVQEDAEAEQPVEREVTPRPKSRSRKPAGVS